jgi:protoheme IX farnesyltransferase
MSDSLHDLSNPSLTVKVEKRSLAWALFKLTKPEIVYLVLITVGTGYFLGSAGQVLSGFHLFAALVGSTLCCAGVCALNQVIEWRRDLRMPRTAKRPIPSGSISPFWAGVWGGLLWSAGLGLLSHGVGMMMAVGAFLTGILYLLVYIPLKSVSKWNTTIGAIPGALPILGGWYAATGSTSLIGWTLFAMLFFWQHSHFYAIAWMYRDDYQVGGFKMLPLGDALGNATFFWIAVSNIGLLLSCFALGPLLKLGVPYYSGIVALHVWFFWIHHRAGQGRSTADARTILKATGIYLQVILIVVVVDRLPFWHRLF